MTKEHGKATLKAQPTDADAWNAEVEKLRKRVIGKHGEGTVDIHPANDFTGAVTWTWRAARKSIRPT